LLSLDASLSIDGAPQSASGQASLLTGKNIPQLLGHHDGPKPSPEIMDVLREGTLFSKLNEIDRSAVLLNAYPPRYFDSIENGYRLPGVIALSARYAGQNLKTMDDLFRGEAISADFSALGWREHLGFTDTPLLDSNQAGQRLAALSARCDLAFFEYWLTDVAGHQQDMTTSCNLLETFDAVLGSLVNEWDDDHGLILITSDHGNLEDLSTRHHTRNHVPLLLIGSTMLREKLIKNILWVSNSRDELNLTDITPAILNQAELAR
jgi:hypothetical protein